MRKAQFPFILAGILIFGLAAGGALGLTIAAAGLAIAYLVSLRLHPRVSHRKCNGTGRHHGAIFTWTTRKCGRCDGGRIVRFGARYWGPDHIRSEHATGKQAREAARDQGSWR